MHCPGVYERGEQCANVCAAGCAIYAERPEPCRDFNCTWLQTDKWPPQLRPDRCGFIVRSDPGGPVFLETVGDLDVNALAYALYSMLLANTRFTARFASMANAAGYVSIDFSASTERRPLQLAWLGARRMQAYASESAGERAQSRQNDDATPD